MLLMIQAPHAPLSLGNRDRNCVGLHNHGLARFVFRIGVNTRYPDRILAGLSEFVDVVEVYRVLAAFSWIDDAFHKAELRRCGLRWNDLLRWTAIFGSDVISISEVNGIPTGKVAANGMVRNIRLNNVHPYGFAEVKLGLWCA